MNRAFLAYIGEEPGAPAPQEETSDERGSEALHGARRLPRCGECGRSVLDLIDLLLAFGTSYP
jgi:hypothetical protein